MIAVRVSLERDGSLASLTLSGHAGAGVDAKVTCAAVTAIVRSCADAIVDRPGIRVSGHADGPGDFHMDLTVTAADRAWLHGVTDVLLGGVQRIARDSPDDVTMRVITQGEDHGT